MRITRVTVCRILIGIAVIVTMATALGGNSRNIVDNEPVKSKRLAKSID